MVTYRPALTLIALAMLNPSAALGQQPDVPASPWSHVALVDGSATIEHDGNVELLGSATPLADGDRLRTTEGRVEVFFQDGSVLYLDESSVLDILAPPSLRLWAGGLTFDVSATARDSAVLPRYQVDTAAAVVRLNGPGEYRISLTDGRESFSAGIVRHQDSRPFAVVEVARGVAQLTNDVGRLELKSGEHSIVRYGEPPGFPVRFNTARWDPFARWVEARRGEHRYATGTQRYLPPDLQVYASTLDRNGSWISDAQFGTVWYPTSGAGWRPYYNGRWAWLPRYGWTWVGTDAWAWPTHHYGRWGINARGSWFWIPGGAWGPGWVSWAIAPTFVSWCPLGFDGRPVIAFSNQWPFAYNRVFDPNAFVYDRVFHPDFAWTTIPGHAFGARVLASRVAVARTQFGDRTPVVVQEASPAWPAASVPLGIRERPRVPSSTQYAVPRGSVPDPTSPDGRDGANVRRPPISSSRGPYILRSPRDAGTPAVPATPPPLAQPRVVVPYQGFSPASPTTPTGAPAVERPTAVPGFGVPYRGVSPMGPSMPAVPPMERPMAVPRFGVPYGGVAPMAPAMPGSLSMSPGLRGPTPRVGFEGQTMPALPPASMTGPASGTAVPRMAFPAVGGAMAAPSSPSSGPALPPASSTAAPAPPVGSRVPVGSGVPVGEARPR